MIGMHGAAFAFSWFLPPGGGAIELFPINHGGNWHMKHIANKNNILYNEWENNNPTNERPKSKSTLIPPKIVVQLLGDMMKNMCHQKS